MRWGSKGHMSPKAVFFIFVVLGSSKIRAMLLRFERFLRFLFFCLCLGFAY